MLLVESTSERALGGIPGPEELPQSDSAKTTEEDQNLSKSS